MIPGAAHFALAPGYLMPRLRRSARIHHTVVLRSALPPTPMLCVHTRLRRFACRLPAYRAEGASGAEGAREGSQGQGRAQRARSPWSPKLNFAGPEGRQKRDPHVCRPSGAGALSLKRSRGCALSRLPLATLCRAFGAPRAFTHTPRLRRSALPPTPMLCVHALAQIKFCRPGGPTETAT
jgi:hypothetical protein